MHNSAPIVRYFYSPSCPESYATLDRLSVLFKKLPVIFESFNFLAGEIRSEHPFFEGEKSLLATRESGEGAALLLGKLYLNGQEVAGFPPSPKDLMEKMLALGLSFDPNKYRIIYQARPDIKGPQKTNRKIRMEFYRKDNLENLARLCTRHHPYIMPGDYREEEWRPHEEKRRDFVRGLLQCGDIIGVIAFDGPEEAGFIEGFPLLLARKMGYPVSTGSFPENSKAVMVTCLSIRTEYKGRGVAVSLLEAFEAEASRQGKVCVEVLAFPDKLGRGWQPASFYRKRGYESIRKVQGLDLMQKQLQARGMP